MHDFKTPQIHPYIYITDDLKGIMRKIDFIVPLGF